MLMSEWRSNSRATIRSLIEKTGTKTGLCTTVRMIEKIYETGRKAIEEFKNNMPIKFDEHFPKLNYQAIPQPTNQILV